MKRWFGSFVSDSEGPRFVCFAFEIKGKRRNLFDKLEASALDEVLGRV